MKNFYIIVFLLLVFSTSVNAQISGPTTVYAGTTTSYSYNDGSTVSGAYWTATKGTVISSGQSGTTYTSEVTWTTTGSALLKIYADDGLVSSRSITVSACSIGAPTGTGGSRCGTGTVALSATVGTNGTTVRWYPVSSGGSYITSGTTFTTPSISTTTTYYITTFNSTTLCESSPRVAVTASVANPGSTSPVTANSFNSTSGTQTLSGNTSTPIRWEKNTNSAGWTTISNTTTSNSYSVGPVATATVTQYRAVLNNACGNPSYSSLSTINVYPNPQILVNGTAPASSTVYRNYGYETTLSITAQSYYSSYQWWRGGQLLSGATTNSYIPADPGTYTLVVGLSGGATYTTSGITVVVPNQQADSVNTASKTIFTKSGLTTSSSRYSLTPSDLQQAFYYSDGLGRVVQTIAVGQSPTGADFVIPSVFGKQGVVDSVFLPYAESGVVGRFRKDAIKGTSAYTSYSSGKQYQAYQGTSKVASDTKPYSVSLYYDDPNLRVKEQGSVGSDWQPGVHAIQSKQRLSTLSYYPVRRWSANGITTSYYPDKTVTGSVVTDENGNTTRKYVDERGLTVLKQVQVDAAATTWLQTYYVYDDFGNLVMQIPPKAMSVLGSGTTLDANSSSVAELIFKYEYDQRGRLIRKKVPGSAAQDIIYDKLDRIVLTQDAIQRSQGVWMFNKYDYKHRLVYGGTYTSASDRSTLQAQFDAIDLNTTTFNESRENNATYQGYSNNTFPTASLAVQRVYYYDDYDFDKDGAADFTYSNSDIAGMPSAANLRTRGLLTGTRVLKLGTTEWITKCVFYDDLDRPLQIQGNNATNTSKDDKTSILYFANNITNNIQKVKVTEVSTSTVKVIQRYTYDNGWRPTAIYHSINGAAEIKIAGFEYNAIGQLVAKKLHDTGTPLQTIDLRYNIRGWLTSINNAKLQNDSGGDTDDYFGMELFYNSAENSSLGNSARYDGSISAVKWKSGGVASGAADQRSYKYNYDNSGRLLSGTFQAYTGAAWTKESNTLNETMTYDVNGNISTLVRNQNSRGLAGTTVTSATSEIDNLTYTYSTTSQNQLVKVADAGDVNAGFVDGANTATEYSYDALGSLTADNNKGISSVTYNHLGKPTLVSFTNGNSISYEYYADGTRFKTVNTVNSVATTTIEIGNSTYVNDTLSYVNSPVGRIVKNGANFEYQYFITDHLGNNRVLFTSATPTPKSVTATFEDDANDQKSQFLSVNLASIESFTGANHTSGGIKVIRMNQSYNVGPSYTRKVYAGDKIDMEVWTYYEPTSGWSSSNLAANVMITAIAGAFGGVSGGTGDAGKIFNGVSDAIGGFGLGPNQADDSPSAFLNYILFDKNYKVLNMGWTAVPESANFSKQKMSIPQVTAKEAGYVFVYLSYEGQSNVYANFDDFKVTYTPTNIIQSNEYYPFGMQTVNSWTRENTFGNDLLANGGTKMNATSNLYDLDFRNYDPILGRLIQVDPMADKYGSYTPYHYSLNDPVSMIDPDGADVLWGLYTREEYAAASGSRDQVRAMGGSGYEAGYNKEGEYGFWRDTQTYTGNAYRVTSVTVSSVFVKVLADGTCTECVNPATLGHNIFYLSYPGGDNPKTYSGKYSYSYVPKRLSEYPAIGHDRRYDNLHIEGIEGLLTDPSAIGADWEFVAEELEIASSDFIDPVTRIQAGLLGVGLGLASLPKTVVQLSSPMGYGQVSTSYYISSIDVTNDPDIHTH